MDTKSGPSGVSTSCHAKSSRVMSSWVPNQRSRSGPDPGSLVFTGPKNAPLPRSNFTRTWLHATESAGLTGFHIHDLRHTGNHFAAATGASLRELMGRMGHSTTRAAVIYQHRTAERDRFIAAAMSQIIEAELANPDRPSGTQRAREDHNGS
jgi:integrase